MQLREKQKSFIKQMLCLQAPHSKHQETDTKWKIIIVDQSAQDILSPLMSVKELREIGVTLHLALHSDREQIPTVPVIYFCAASDENLDRINQDMRNNLYEIYHFNFLTPMSRQKLEDLANTAVLSNSVANIQSIYDQYLNFITLEDDFFILRHQNKKEISYFAMNRPYANDLEIESITQIIAEGLFSVFVSLGHIPIIRCLKNSSAEMVAKKLEKLIREELWDSKSTSFKQHNKQSNLFNSQRILLVIFDRNVDMATPLHHAWTYQALAHDVLNYSLNSIRLPKQPGQNNTASTIIDMSSNEAFWQSHKASPFPNVAEAIQNELSEYKSAESQIQSLKSSVGGFQPDKLNTVTSIDTQTASISNAIDLLPTLLEKKKSLDNHTKIATEILNYIKQRHLDTYFEMEEKFVSKATMDRSIQDVLGDPNLGTQEDKMRLFLIYFICNNVSESELDNFKKILIEQGCDLTSLLYIQRWKSVYNFKKVERFDYGETKSSNVFSKIVSHGSNFVMEGVKNLVVKRHMLPITKMTASLLDGHNDKDDFLFIDPKAMKSNDSSASKMSFNEAVVFMVGGGNYLEYQNLMDYNKQSNMSGTRKVVYGATSLENGTEFLKQISLLGKEN